MTNNMTIFKDTIAPAIAQAADHMRIWTMIAEGRRDHACSLIVSRLNDAVNGFVEGDIVEDDDLVHAYATINSMPGPLAQMAMHSAAADWVDSH